MEGAKELAELPAQLDSAADITVVPAGWVERLGLIPFGALQVAGFGGVAITARTFLTRLNFRGQEQVVLKIVSSAEESHILLGRDILNRYRILLDGPGGFLEIH
jgi:hypothetical protein